LKGELTLIATLGSEAQVVTLTLDALLKRGERVQRVIVVHTAPATELIAASLARLLAELRSPVYSSSLDVENLILTGPSGPLADVDSTDGAAAAFTTLYRVVRAEKLAGRAVHLSIAGGRKTMTVFGMAVAQMLFDAEDRLSHLVSQGALLAEKRMHAGPGDECHLIEIPVLLWSAVSPVLTDLSQIDDPFAAVERQRALRLQESLEEARAFVLGSLSPAERRVVEQLVREGLSDQELAVRLSLSPRTVEKHLGEAYAKAGVHWGLAGVDRTRLVALLSVYAALTRPGEGNGGKYA
jgi:CRISPR-associated Csx14 family protein